MAFVLPTADQFIARFPIFADRDPDLITALIAEASGSVDDTWDEADYQPAILYLAAHLLATDNSLEGDEVIIGNLGSNIVASESFGGMSVSYQKGADSKSEFYGSTVYGRRFLNLLVANRPGVVGV